MIDDYGQQYRPIGAPASFERVKVQYPRLINVMRIRLAEESYSTAIANDDLKIQNGITSKIERDSIIEAAKQDI